MSRNSRQREKCTSLRPRPVTATVTKPSWMRPEAIVGPRSRSLESRGSTASLTSVLDHDSCESFSEGETEEERILEQVRNQQHHNKENIPRGGKHHQNLQPNLNKQDKKPMKKKIVRKFVESSVTDDNTEAENEPSMSPWERWLLLKVKDDRQKRREERERKREEKRKKEEELAQKRAKEIRAEEVRREWVERKTFEEKLKIKVEKQRSKTEQMISEEKKKMQDVKSERKFNDWLEQKKREAKEKKSEEKMKAQIEEKERKEQKIKAQAKFEEWCRKADQRPKPLPNSFGYTSGKLTGYHDTSAYPVPTFYNPMPWQPIHIPRPASEKKKQKRRPKTKYAWNPEKYR